MLKAYVAFAESKIGMRNADVDSAALCTDFKLHNPNMCGTLSYRTNLGTDWRLDAGMAY